MAKAGNASRKQRLDQALVAAGLAPSRSRAQALVLAGKVRINDEPASKAGQSVKPDDVLSVPEPDHSYASRGGAKLAGALAELDFEPQGLVVLDVGASTGGFTDCLLQQGARAVIALDVGYGQLAWALRTDERVTVLERTNIRHVPPDLLQPPPQAAVADCSFISLRLVIPKLLEVLPAAAPVLALIKPQFEAGRAEVGKGGVVRDPAVRERVVTELATWCESQGCQVLGTALSPLPGPKGNREIFVHFLTPGSAVVSDPA